MCVVVFMTTSGDYVGLDHTFEQDTLQILMGCSSRPVCLWTMCCYLLTDNIPLYTALYVCAIYIFGDT